MATESRLFAKRLRADQLKAAYTSLARDCDDAATQILSGMTEETLREFTVIAM